MVQATARSKTTPHGELQNSKNTQTKSERKSAIRIIGDIASVMSVIMYVSYIPQIAANLAGDPGVPWQPLAAFFNCAFWSIYGLGSKPRLWPIVIANVPGVLLAAIAFITCFIH